jgi:hypothetical protein
VKSCKRCEGHGTINPAPYEKLVTCPDCAGSGREDPNAGNPFEPPETQEQRIARVSKLIRENADRRAAEFRRLAELPHRQRKPEDGAR